MTQIVQWCKFIIHCFIWLFLHVFWIFPVNRHKILFIAFHSERFCCNPKYLYEYIQRYAPKKYTCVWSFKDVGKQSMVPDARIAQSHTVRSVLERMTAGYIITNNEFPWFVPLKKSQVLVETWHGGGAYKKTGIALTISKLSNLNQWLRTRRISYYVSSCARFTEVQSKAKRVPVHKFLDCGMPRNAIFFGEHPEVTQKVRDALGLGANERLVLYAPTYRGLAKKHEGCDVLDCSLTAAECQAVLGSLAERFGGTWRMAYRGHWYDALTSVSTGGGVINATGYEDMQELLYAADAFITDCSSSMWDFALTRRPGFCLMPDLDQYDMERGFFTPPADWPFAMTRSAEELCIAIEGYDAKAATERIERHFALLGSYENPDSARLVLEKVGLL